MSTVTKEETKPDSKKKRRWLVLAFRTVMTAVIIGVLLQLLSLAEMLAAIQRVGIGPWLLIFASHLVVHVILASKWRLLVRAAGNPCTMSEAVSAYGAGLFSNAFLPSIIGGDVVRMGLIVRSGGNLPAAVLGSVADRVTDAAAMILIAAVGFLLLPTAHVQINVGMILMASLGLVSSIVCVAIAIRFMKPDKLTARVAHPLGELRRTLDSMLEHKSAALQALIISTLMQGFFTWQNILIGKAMGMDVPAAAWLIAWPLSKLISFLPISLGGVGVRQSAVAALLLPFGAPVTLSVAQSVVWQTVAYACSLTGGLGWLWMGRSKSREGLAPAVAVTPDRG